MTWGWATWLASIDQQARGGNGLQQTPAQARNRVYLDLGFHLSWPGYSRNHTEGAQTADGSRVKTLMTSATPEGP